MENTKELTTNIAVEEVITAAVKIPGVKVNRDKFLASFDGSVLASGSHTVVGTILVRTSDELTASQQKRT